MKGPLSVFGIIIGVALSIGLFQNCSQSELVFEDKLASLTFKQLNYRYSEKPSFYIEPQLILEPEPNSGNRFKVMLYIGRPSDSEAKGTVHMKVVDDQDRLICPQDSLDLSTGTKTWTINCVPPGQFSTARLSVSVEGTDHDFSYTQNYYFD